MVIIKNNGLQVGPIFLNMEDAKLWDECTRFGESNKQFLVVNTFVRPEWLKDGMNPHRAVFASEDNRLLYIERWKDMRRMFQQRLLIYDAYEMTVGGMYRATQVCFWEYGGYERIKEIATSYYMGWLRGKE